MALLLLMLPFLSGCVSTGPSPEVVAALKTETAQNTALAKAHKITFVEAANRNNAAIERAAGNALTNQDRLLMSYRVALSSEVDAGRMTYEVANYKFLEKKTEIENANEDRRRAALLALSQSLQASAPVHCTSVGGGGIVTTNCY
ncbi:MAG: hypothetical protein ACYC5H_19080 [Methylovirgula sp.]